ncbi:SCO family protein [Akkermansiaceae bacterium]|nr:SCO family protein [Akkermansiaceae bacterium]
MTDKQKIITIYGSVVLASALIMFIAFAIRGENKDLAEVTDTPQFRQETNFDSVLTLEEDITLQNQDGEEVKISDLKGKVWAFAQFYAFCPMCAERNDQGLKDLYNKFKADPDFMVVCITVDPENDTTESLKSYAKALGADTSDWLFLTGDAEPLKKYMVEEMKYQSIVKRSDPEAAAKLGAYEHDMSIAIFDRDLGMVKRHDLFNAKEKGDAFYKGEENKLHFTVETLLKK